jgi:hypothetical protein
MSRIKKLKVKSSKFQAPSSKEVPNPKLQTNLCFERFPIRQFVLEFGDWDLFGAWNLELGTWNLELGTWQRRRRRHGMS